MKKKRYGHVKLLAAVLAAAVLAGCGHREAGESAQPGRAAPPAIEASQPKAQARPKKQKGEAPPKVEYVPFGSLEDIAALGGLKATVQRDEEACIVFIFDEEKNHGNPYDVTWDYGDDYDACVDAADWSLVFDADYYKSQFPLLAQQYHNDDALLLRHFQTVGIHEGRQGSERFNVAAYMQNCDRSLRKAFGSNYECYYLYYLLHQGTEAGVKTTGNYKAQIAQELTIIQAEELRWTNYYRKEAGAGTVKFDAELAAFANYRAYMDCTEGWDAHDGLEHINTAGQMNALFFDLAHADLYCENKDTVGGSKESIVRRCRAAYSDYRTSPSHYETMVDPDYGYVGCGNWFVSDQDYNWGGKYEVNRITLDTYADVVRNPFHDR